MARPALLEKARTELREFAFLSLYLWICFGALVLLKDSILQSQGVAYLPLGFAAIKAVVSAKFIMVGRLLHVAESRGGERLIVSVLRKTLALLVLLAVLTVIEEVGIAAIHGRSLSAAIAGLGGGTAYQAAATLVVVALILLPYVAFRALGEALGEETLRRLLFERRPMR